MGAGEVAVLLLFAIALLTLLAYMMFAGPPPPSLWIGSFPQARHRDRSDSHYRRSETESGDRRHGGP